MGARSLDMPWTNGFVERLQGTILSELWRPAFRRTYYTKLEQLQQDLRSYLCFYNRDRPHRSYRLRGNSCLRLPPGHEVSYECDLGWRPRCQPSVEFGHFSDLAKAAGPSV